MISDRCVRLRRLIPVVKADEAAVEQIENAGDGTDSPLQGAGYGLYAIFGRPAGKPLEIQAQEYYRSLSPRADMTAKSIMMKKWRHEHTQRRGSPWASRQ
jgi:hypothetical protein